MVWMNWISKDLTKRRQAYDISGKMELQYPRILPHDVSGRLYADIDFICDASEDASGSPRAAERWSFQRSLYHRNEGEKMKVDNTGREKNRKKKQ